MNINDLKKLEQFRKELEAALDEPTRKAGNRQKEEILKSMIDNENIGIPIVVAYIQPTHVGAVLVGIDNLEPDEAIDMLRLAKLSIDKAIARKINELRLKL